MREQRLSHSYCRDCDVYFYAANECPRCASLNLTHPPRGAPIVNPKRDKYQRWISTERQATISALIGRACADLQRLRTGTPSPESNARIQILLNQLTTLIRDDA